MSTSLSALRSAVDDRSAVVGVIGLGYVGLPAACLFADAGFKVLGIDLDAERSKAINSGQSPIEGDEPGLSDLVARVVAADRLHAGTQHSDLAEADVVLVCVETPVDADHRPRFKALRAACRALGPVLKDGALVIVESTLAPGTIDRVVRPALVESTGGRGSYHLGHCPERVMPGKLLRNMRTMSRVCGGSTAEVASVMVAFYSAFVEGDLDPADCLTAELVKTAENAYRDVGIAFANQLALICESTGGDVWRVRQLVNKVPGRDILRPGGGVGGHCIPKDSWLLAFPMGEQAEGSLLGVARKLNDRMPAHVADLVGGLLGAGRDLRVAVLGYAYLENSDDTRNSPTAELVRLLSSRGMTVVVHDPFVHVYRGDVMDAFRSADCAVLMVAHSAYRSLDLAGAARLMRTRAMVDARGFFAPHDMDEAGFHYRLIGVGGGLTAQEDLAPK